MREQQTGRYMAALGVALVGQVRLDLTLQSVVPTGPHDDEPPRHRIERGPMGYELMRLDLRELDAYIARLVEARDELAGHAARMMALAPPVTTSPEGEVLR